jgi:hypothetical protein
MMVLSEVGDFFDDTFDFAIDNLDEVINYLIDFSSLSVNLIKGLISLFPICAELIKNIIPLLENSMITLKQIFILLPFLSIMYGIASLIKEIEKPEKNI